VVFSSYLLVVRVVAVKMIMQLH